MKYIRQFLIILAFSFVGDCLSRQIPLPIPGSIYGILLMFLALVSGLLPVEAVRDTGKFLIEIMPVMFISPAVGLLNSWELVRNSWITYLLIMTSTTVIVMAVTGRVTQFVIRTLHKKEDTLHD